MVVGESMKFVTSTMTVSPSLTLISGPGIWLLKARAKREVPSVMTTSAASSSVRVVCTKISFRVSVWLGLVLVLEPMLGLALEPMLG